MTNPNFENLAEESAAGLRADRELFLDVKQELRAHLDDTAAHFESEGKTPEESAEQAARAFGSPLDIAAELLDANRRRMRLRAIARMMLTAVLLPVAILLALYLGYGRFARLAGARHILMHLMNVDMPISPPTLPWYGISSKYDEPSSLNINSAESMRQNWEQHKNEQAGREFYATYALLYNNQDTNDPAYFAVLQKGEKIEPDNALYPYLLASNYFYEGLKVKRNIKGSPFFNSYKVKDRNAIEKGIAALRRAVIKPYIRMYDRERIRKLRDLLPGPVLAEDYAEYVSTCRFICYPYFSLEQNFLRNLSCVSRQLLAEGKKKEAEEVMDAWKPYINHLANQTDNVLTYHIATQHIGRILANDAAHLYPKLGKYDKAKEAAETFKRLSALRKERRFTPLENHQEVVDHLRDYASILTYRSFPIFDTIGVTNFPSREELTPARMLDHIMIEQIAVMALLSILIILTVAALFQGFFWHLRLRRAAAAPILLLPPPCEIARILLFGVALPIAAYAIYTRLPIIGGREYGWASPMRWRFALEILLIFTTILFFAARMARGYVRRRYEALGLEFPTPREEKRRILLMFVAFIVALLLLAFAFFTSVGMDAPFFLETLIVGCLIAPITLISFWNRHKSRGRICLVMIIICIALILEFCLVFGTYLPVHLIAAMLGSGLLFYTLRSYWQGDTHALYYGTIARSLAPIYACAILILALVVQPVLMTREAYWLKRDPILFGYITDKNNPTAGFTLIETRAAEQFSAKLRAALKGK